MFKLLLIILILGYLFSRIIGPVMRFLLKRYMRNMQGQNPGSHTQDRDSGRRRSRPEGSVTIEYDPRKDKGSKGGRRKHPKGEYVDYEEL